MSPCTCKYMIVKVPKTAEERLAKGEQMLLFPPVDGDAIYMFSTEQEAILFLESIVDSPMYADVDLIIKHLSNDCTGDC